MIRVSFIFGAAFFLAGCGTSRTPVDARQSATPHRISFAQSAPTVKACLVPGLDTIRPFNFPPADTRPVTVRDLPNKSEIFALDEMITLYVVDLEPAGPTRSIATIYSVPDRITKQIDEIARSCGGV